MKSELQEQIIKDTYGVLPNQQYYGVPYGSPQHGKAYPTWEFLRAWHKRSKRGLGDRAGTIELFYDPSNFSEGVHDSIATGENMDDDLAEILNFDGMQGAWMREWGSDTLHFVGKKRKPYWTRFIEKMRRGRLREIVKQKASDAGIKLT